MFFSNTYNDTFLKPRSIFNKFFHQFSSNICHYNKLYIKYPKESSTVGITKNNAMKK